MRHCVADLTAEALSGERVFYAVEIDRRSITVELTRGPDGRLFLGEMFGFANREAKNEERLMMIPWLESVGVENVPASHEARPRS